MYFVKIETKFNLNFKLNFIGISAQFRRKPVQKGSQVSEINCMIKYILLKLKLNFLNISG